MIKSNVKAFLIHIVISIISVVVFIIFNSTQVKWASKEAANQHHYSMMIVASTVIVVACILYYFLAQKLLTYQGSIYRNFLAASLTAILGVFIWIAAFNINLTGLSNYLLNSELWQFYSMYNGYSLFFLSESGINNSYIYLFFSFLPTIAMAIGMQRKVN